MKIAIPVESRSGENRVILMPSEVEQLATSYAVLVEEGAGSGLGVSDQMYQNVGAVIVDNNTIWQDADFLIKLKRPTAAELDQLSPTTRIAALFHAEGAPELVRTLLERQIRAFSFEFFQDPPNYYPLMAATGEIAGIQAIIYAAYHLQSSQDGSGVMLAACSTQPGATVTIIGFGHVGQSAAKVAVRLGASVSVIRWSRSDPPEAPWTSDITFFQHDDPICTSVLQASDVVVGAIRISTYDTNPFVTEEIVAKMRAGSVIVDVTAGYESGFIATSGSLTSLDEPYRIVQGVKHIKIRQLPLGVSRTAAIQISKIYLPFIARMLDAEFLGVEDAASRRAIITSGGQLLK